MAAPHVLVLPFPAQGHVIPLMELSHRLVDQGFEVTFVNTEVNHTLVLGALPANGAGRSLDGIRLVSLPDGLADADDRKHLSKLVNGYERHMPGHLEELIRGIEASGGTKFRWLIADLGMGWAFEVAKKLGIKSACFWAPAAAFIALAFRIPQLMRDGVIDDKGWPKRQETFRLSPKMPPLHTSLIPWNKAGPPEGQPAIFQLTARDNEEKDLAEVIVCNSFHVYLVPEH
ncbi:UDP-glycosyltransferase 83A1 [Dichanthelium oligosanthes]|uniref:UDP-glycosyltransferase 83A1 n=1 Tax=Dichanthelium oligosanthes TaxID=888268 RepID=A0A1E5VBJ2_9POAL|nr:UDP-glycosyltransferase 83A1 [Dichanthelium oligosanthes]